MATVEEFIQKHSQWESQLKTLRSILKETDLEESIKWGAPVYGFGTKNVIGLGAFKSYVGLWFFNGVFLKDEAKVLENANEEKTKALRQWRFYEGDVIDKSMVKNYVLEAIDNQKNGREITADRSDKALIIPTELASALKADKTLKSSFEKLTLAKQREYTDHISSAKQEKTKISRLEKALPLINEGKGLYDKYKNC